MSYNLPAAAVSLSQESWEAYSRQVQQIAVLSAEEERELAVRLHEEQDLDAARQLILANLRFVMHVARTYSGYGLSQADLVQEGNVGLMKAVKRFDPYVGVRLISFAVHWIKAEIHEYIIRNWRIVKIATTKAQRKLFFNLRNAKKRLGWFSQEEAETVARDLGVTPREVYEMEGRLNAHDQAFDGYGDDKEGAESVSLAPAQFLEDMEANPAAVLESSEWESHAQRRLHHALEALDERSQAIIKRRWLDDEHKATLHDLADEYGVSAERIRQLEKAAMKKLQNQLSL